MPSTEATDEEDRTTIGSDDLDDFERAFVRGATRGSLSVATKTEAAPVRFTAFLTSFTMVSVEGRHISVVKAPFSLR